MFLTEIDFYIFSGTYTSLMKREVIVISKSEIDCTKRMLFYIPSTKDESTVFFKGKIVFKVLQFNEAYEMQV